MLLHTEFPYHCLSQLNVRLLEAEAVEEAFDLLRQLCLSSSHQKLVLPVEVVKLDSDGKASPAYVNGAHHSRVAQLLGNHFFIKMQRGLVTDEKRPPNKYTLYSTVTAFLAQLRIHIKIIANVAFMDLNTHTHVPSKL